MAADMLVTLEQLSGSHGPAHHFVARVIEKLPLTDSIDCIGLRCAHLVLQDAADTRIVLQVFEEDVDAGVLDQMQCDHEYCWTGCVVGYRHQRHPWLQPQDATAQAQCAAYVPGNKLAQFAEGSSFQETGEERLVTSVCRERYHSVTQRACALCRTFYMGGKQLLCLGCTCGAMRDPPAYAEQVFKLALLQEPTLATDSDAAFALIHALALNFRSGDDDDDDDHAEAKKASISYKRIVEPLITQQGFCKEKQSSIAFSLVACVADLHARKE
jgi:hypothetical protein